MNINWTATPVADRARDFAMSWVETAEEMNPPVIATQHIETGPVRQYVYIQACPPRIEPTIFEWFFWSNIFSSPRQNITYNITNINSSPVTEHKKKEKDSDGSAMIIAGITVLIAAAIGLGVAVKELGKACKLQETADEIPRSGSWDAIDDIRWNAENILDRRVSKLANYTISTTGLLIAGAAMFVGGFCAIPVVGQVGVVLAVMFGVYLLINASYHWNDSDEDLMRYKAIQKQYNEIEAAYGVRKIQESTAYVVEPFEERDVKFI